MGQKKGYAYFKLRRSFTHPGFPEHEMRGERRQGREWGKSLE